MARESSSAPPPWRRSVSRTVVLAATWWCGAGAAGAQVPAPSPPKVAIVLSGGSAKGFAHIGVLRVLEDAGIPIDVVTGTSMGSLVGGLYALGYSPAELENVATGQNWDGMFSDPTGPSFISPSGRTLDTRTVVSFPLQHGRVQLPSGLVAGQQITRLLARLTWPAVGIDDFRRLSLPFIAAATDIETGQAVDLVRGSLPQAIRASLSLPGVLRPVTIDGRLLVDGGIARNLPSQEAKALGADILICSDVSEPPSTAANLRSFFDVLLQTVTFQMEASTVEQRRLCDVVIQPDIKGLAASDFNTADAWIRRGVAAAQDALPRVTEATRDAGTRGPPARPAAPRERVFAALDVRGLSDEGRGFAERALQLELPGALTADQLDAAIDRLYRTGALDSVSYRAEGDASALTLIVEAAPRAADALGFGFRYDSRFKASLLFDVTLHSLGRFGSTTRMALRLGEQLEVSGQHLLRAGTTSGIITGIDASYVETPISIFAGDVRVAEARVNVTNASAFVGRRVGRRGLGSIRVTAEHARGGTRVSAVEAAEARSFYLVAGGVSVDAFDQTSFPRRGLRLLARSSIADRRIGSGSTFWHHVVDAQSAIPLGRRLSFHTRGMAGAAGGADLPFHYQFFLGGAIPSAVFADRQPTFPGLRPQERAGGAVQLLQLGLQYEVADRVYVSVKGHVGNTADTWRFGFDDYRQGYELSVGARTFLGPLEVIGSGSGGRPSVQVRLGHVF